MSYILDALKKSEQERGHGNVPDVQTIHSSSLNYRSEKKTYWPYILITAVILNLMAIIYFIVDKQATEEVTATAQQAGAAAHTTIENEVAPDKNKISEDSAAVIDDLDKNTEPGRSIIETTANTTDKSVKPPSKAEPIITSTEQQVMDSKADIIDFDELPESIKQELPAIVISAHVYSTNPVQRSIVINNNFLEEGEYVLDGLILYEITPNGAIFNYQGMLFSYGVVSGWQ